MRNWKGKCSSKTGAVDESAALKAAQELIRAGGLLNLKMKSVAERCGCSVGTIYRHFSSKDDLLAALLLQEMRRRNDFYAKLAACRTNSRRRILGLLCAGFIPGAMHRQPSQKNWISALEASLPPMSGQKREALKRLQEDLLETIGGIVNEAHLQGDLSGNAMDPADLCQVLLILMRGGQLLVEAPAFRSGQRFECPQDVMILNFSRILNALGWHPICHSCDPGGPGISIEQMIRSVV